MWGGGSSTKMKGIRVPGIEMMANVWCRLYTQILGWIEKKVKKG